MQMGIFGSCFDNFGRRAGLLSAIALLCSAPPDKLLGQDVGSLSESVLHVHGVVLNALTNRPVDRALVTCMNSARMTDGEGRFEFDVRLSIANTAGGSVSFPGFAMHGGRENGYTIVLMARRPGYLAMQRPTMRLLHDKSPDEPEVQIKIMPESILRGRVTTSAVAPPMGVQVQLLRKQVQDGLASWGPIASAQTNSQGEFRFANLATGDYKMMTREWVESESTIPVPGKQITGYPPAYYPNELDLATATPIHIAAGRRRRQTSIYVPSLTTG